VADTSWARAAPTLIEELTAVENVELPALLAGDGAHVSRGRAVELLERVGLTDPDRSSSSPCPPSSSSPSPSPSYPPSSRRANQSSNPCAATLEPRSVSYSSSASSESV
jgi:hypothetical protein